MDYRLLDDELPRLVAARVGTSADVVESLSDRTRGFGERLLAGFPGAVPELAQPAAPPPDDLSAACRREIELLIRAAANSGDVVINGRLGGAILGARPDLVRVFVFAPPAWRIANISRSLATDAAHARSEMMRIDEARRTIARDFYGIVWDDIRNYELAVDTARLGIEGAAAVVAAAVRAACGR